MILQSRSIAIPESTVTVFNGTNGTDGTNAYLYIASADDNSGTGFTYPHDPTQEYTAFLNTQVIINSPQASDFAGFWQKTLGTDGTDGTNSTIIDQYTDVVTPGDPTTGHIKFNSTDPNFITTCDISSTQRDTSSIYLVLKQLDNSNTTKGTILVQRVTNPADYILFDFIAVTDNTTYFNLSTNNIIANNFNNFVNNEEVSIVIYAPGDKGDTGTSGNNGNAGADAIVSTTSTSNLTIGTGSKSFTTVAALTLNLGSWLIVADHSNPGTINMTGQIISISGTSVTINVTQGIGFGTSGTTWDISLTPAPSPTLSTTSNTSVSYGTGSATFTTDTVLTVLPGANVIISDPSNPDTDYMLAKVASISGTTLDVIVTFDSTGGAGANNPWNIQVQGEPGKETDTGFQETTLIVASTDAQTLFNTPVLFIPAQGVNTAVQIIEGTARLQWNAAQYGATPALQIIGDSSGIVYAECSGNLWNENTDAIYNFTLPLLSSSAASLGLNEDLLLQTVSVDPAAPGDSQVTFNCTYKVSRV